jgi:hypothetical protein
VPVSPTSVDPGSSPSPPHPDPFVRNALFQRREPDATPRPPHARVYARMTHGRHSAPRLLRDSISTPVPTAPTLSLNSAPHARPKATIRPSHDQADERIAPSDPASDEELVPLMRLVLLKPDGQHVTRFVERPNGGILKLRSLHETFGLSNDTGLYYRFEPKHDRTKMWVAVRPSGLNMIMVEMVYLGLMRDGRDKLGPAFAKETGAVLDLD